jgi:molybdenum cofactor synthesis domain-containing protein
MFKAGVLIVSDKGAAGTRKDDTGDIVVDLLEKNGYSVSKRKIVADEQPQVTDILIHWTDNDGLSLIVTSGGTGLSPRDVTPQATSAVIDYEAPGMAEAMRAASLRITPHAMLSRAVCGIRKTCLIINLPGSPSGAKDNLMVVLPALRHALTKLAGDMSDCVTGPVHEPEG